MLCKKVSTDGVSMLFAGATAQLIAGFVGHYPWYYTFNLLHAVLPPGASFRCFPLSGSREFWAPRFDWSATVSGLDCVLLEHRRNMFDWSATVSGLDCVLLEHRRNMVSQMARQCSMLGATAPETDGGL